MKQKSQLPVAPENWDALKGSVPGLAGVARGLIKAPTFNIADIRIISANANYSASMRILAKNGLRSMTYMEVLLALDIKPELKEQLTGKWFWVDGVGTKLNGDYIIQPGGYLKKGKSEDPERNISFSSGYNPLFFYVYNFTDTYGRRFYITADDSTNPPAPVVVGVPKDVPTNRILEGVRRQL